MAIEIAPVRALRAGRPPTWSRKSSTQASARALGVSSVERSAERWTASALAPFRGDFNRCSGSPSTPISER